MIDKERKEILYRKLKYEVFSVGEAERLAKEVGLQSVCDGDQKLIWIELDLKNNE